MNCVQKIQSINASGLSDVYEHVPPITLDSKLCLEMGKERLAIFIVTFWINIPETNLLNMSDKAIGNSLADWRGKLTISRMNAGSKVPAKVRVGL